MVTNIQQAAYSYYLLAHYIPYGKFEAVLTVYPYRRYAHLFTLQDFVIQRIDTVKLFDSFSMFQVHHALVITLYYFRLVAVLFITRASLLKQFAQILLIELYKHSTIPALSAKITLLL